MFQRKRGCCSADPLGSAGGFLKPSPYLFQALKEAAVQSTQDSSAPVVWVNLHVSCFTPGAECVEISPRIVPSFTEALPDIIRCMVVKLTAMAANLAEGIMILVVAGIFLGFKIQEQLVSARKRRRKREVARKIRILDFETLPKTS